MVVSFEAKIIKHGNRYGVFCPEEWNAYRVSICIYPKGLWKGIKYHRFKHQGKWHRAFDAKNSDIYGKRLIWVYSVSLASWKNNKHVEFAEVPAKYHGLRCNVAITIRTKCAHCGKIS